MGNFLTVIFRTMWTSIRYYWHISAWRTYRRYIYSQDTPQKSREYFYKSQRDFEKDEAGSRGLVLGSAIKYAIRQRLATTAKPYIVKHVTAGYGELAGGIAGVGISIAIGDYYGAFTGITGNIGNKPPNGRNPPFGYLERREGLNGPTNGTFNQTYRANINRNGNRRNRK